MVFVKEYRKENLIMGRWVTSKGRRIYIPDEGEENPFAKKDDDISMRKSVGKVWVAHKSERGKKAGVRDLDRPFNTEEEAIKFADTLEGKGQDDTSKTISDNEAKKEKELAENKRQAENASGKGKAFSELMEKGDVKVGGLTVERGSLYNPKTGKYDGGYGKKTAVTGVDAKGRKVEKTFNSPEKAMEYAEKHSGGTAEKKSVPQERLMEVIDKYNTSTPVSGSWDTETAHEQATIAKEFGVSYEQAKRIMIDQLGFDEDDKWIKKKK